MNSRGGRRCGPGCTGSRPTPACARWRTAAAGHCRPTFAPGEYPDAPLAAARPEVPWLQPIPDALLSAGSTDPAEIVASRQGTRLALIAALRFTHICATSKKGRFWIRRKTDSKRVRAKLAEVKAETRRRRCLPIPEQGRWLAAVVRGHQAYYAVPGNSDAVNAFRTQVIRHWHTALRRRSQRTRITWDRMNRIATRWIPQTRTVHPFPQARFAATHPR